ncbi:hypothetical protein V1511DRAFT_494516 [Dipodascopsis uninucleata]
MNFYRRGTRNPYVDNVPLDDTNDTIFLGESDEDDDDFFFNSEGLEDGIKDRQRSPFDPAGEFRTLPITHERIYVSKPPSWEQVEQRDDSDIVTAEIQGFSLLILLTNGLGIDSINNQLLADSFALHGYFVVMPDLFSGDPNSSQKQTSGQPSKSSQSGFSISRVRSFAVSGVVGFMTDMWMARHTEEKTWPILVQMVDEIVEIYRPRDMCVVGYSFGGKYALKILQLPILDAKNERKGSTSSVDVKAASEATLLNQLTTEQHKTDLLNPSWSRLVLTGIVCHPSLVEPKDFIGVKKPLLIIAVENDSLFPPDLIKRGVSELSKYHIFYDLKIYDSKLPHGFAVKGDYSSDNRLVSEKQDQAHKEIVSWIKSFVS